MKKYIIDYKTESGKINSQPVAASTADEAVKILRNIGTSWGETNFATAEIIKITEIEEKKNKYLVQSILLDSGIETVIDSRKTDDYKSALDFMMQKHKHSTNYLYIVMEIETLKVLVHTTKNVYGC